MHHKEKKKEKRAAGRVDALDRLMLRLRVRLGRHGRVRARFSA
jgi:hypothetical protein